MSSDLRRRAERIMNLQDQIKELQSDVKDLLDTAASDGFSKVALRKAIKVYRMDRDRRDKHDQDQGDFEIYLSELEGKKPE